MRWRAARTLALTATFGALSLVACRDDDAESAFVTSVAQIGDVRDSVPATGILVAPGAAEIRAPKSGVIATVHVAEGQRVRAGQVLATLAAPERNPARDEAAAAAAAADAAYRESEVILHSAREKLERSRTLEQRGFVSPAGVRTAESEVDRAKAAIDRLASDRAAARARLRLAAAEGASADVVAPLDGVVTLVDARPGQQVAPGDARALFQTVKGDDDLQLEILIAEADISRVDMHSKVEFSVDAYPGVKEAARLVAIGSAPIREGRFTSYRGVAEVDNFAGVLKPGMTASVQLVRADAASVVRIPIDAAYYSPPDHIPPLEPGQLEELKRREHGNMRLVRAGANGLQFRRLINEGKRVVFLLEKGKPVRREVRIGAETEDFVEITEGLKPGEIVIVRDRRDARDAV